MAERFACDPNEAGLVARELIRMRGDLHISAHPLENGAGAAVRGEIAGALSEFHAAVMETRAVLTASIDHASGLFAGLSEGTLDLDRVFAERAGEM